MSILFSYFEYFSIFFIFCYLIISWLISLILSFFFLIFNFILRFHFFNFWIRSCWTIRFTSSIFRKLTSLWLWTYLFWILANCILTIVIIWELFLILLNLNLLCFNNFHFKIEKFCILFFIKLFQLFFNFYLFFKISFEKNFC